MDYSTNKIDPHDELRRLQDKVRRLEIQNEQLRSQTSNRNGLVEKLGCDIAGKGDAEELTILNKSSSSLDACQLIKVAAEDHSHHERWLDGVSSEQGKNTYLDYQAVLHQDINNNNNEFQVMRRAIVQRIEDLKQVSLKSIDTRTFTRPKKRISRPALETMLEVPIMEHRQLLKSPWFSKKNMQSLGDNIDDVSMIESSLSSLTSEPENANLTFCSTDFPSINSFHHITITQGVDTKDKSSLHLNTGNMLLSTTFERHCAASQPNQNKSQEQGNINAVQVTTLFNKTTSINQDYFPKDSIHNTTYTMVDGDGSGSSRHSGRTASCESGLDDDQLSSASDSSYSSASKPMNVGDVQIIAHIQEESLKEAGVKQVNSTPVRGFREESFPNFGEDVISPIVPDNGLDAHHGYQSDHSDHSSADSRAKSSRSSIRSSCSSSPCGSTNVLTTENDNVPHQHLVGLPSRQFEAIPSARKPAASVIQHPESIRSRPSSGLRPPSIRPPRINAGQPQGRPMSGIPRLPSRLPAPRLRLSVAGQPTNKTNARHGYY